MSIFAILANDPTQTKSWILPEKAEIIYGCIASILVFSLLVKFAGPALKKSLSARTDRIQKDIDASAGDLTRAQDDATQIRQALGDIASEKARLISEATTQATSLLADGRARLTVEIAELEARAVVDLGTAAGRVTDEMRAEIARLSAVAIDSVLPTVLDAAHQQTLVENFISKVGASR